MTSSPSGADDRPGVQGRLHLPLPSMWPVWIVPAVLAFFQVMGTLGAQRGDTQGPPWVRQNLSGEDVAPHIQPLDGLGLALLLAGPALLLLRRRHPAVTLAGVGTVTVLFMLRAYAWGPGLLSLAVAIVAPVVAGQRLFAWAGTFAVMGGYFAVSAVIGVPFEQRGRADQFFPVEEPSLAGLSFAVAWAVVPLISGELIRMRAQRAAASARTRAEAERRQASEERLRMARELHDVLAHNISMINVQAGVALHLIDQDPHQARTALAAIKEASKEALTEMRSVIGVLRSQGESAPRAPTAGLDRLDELLGRARSAGLTVDAEITGERRPLPAGTDLAAFRIVQESLTNVSRHAGPGPVTARVRIAYGDREISVRVDDDGRGVSLLDDHPGGSGINGMRERAAALGGTFSAGPRPEGGFGVRATLPIDEERPG
ncbi:sensor histidine kinase [Actinomadura sp. NBRC 104412]|uniref:sensor histidine kinase n=1 Tax=Actinomadura sp. NBRC 104412 TaxID=3032203 RepID=UPI002552F1C2|nr:sensor histidine kinase [Actinomadura sp. NBRC 104412]